MSGFFADGTFTRRDIHRQVEHRLTEFFHRGAVKIRTGVHIHVLFKHFIASRRRDDLNCWHEREIRNRTVPSDKENHVGPGCHLPCDALQIVAGAVHEVVTRILHQLTVIDDVIETDIGMPLHRCAD